MHRRPMPASATPPTARWNFSQEPPVGLTIEQAADMAGVSERVSKFVQERQSYSGP